jgi:hypothetical protein
LTNTTRAQPFTLTTKLPALPTFEPIELASSPSILSNFHTPTSSSNNVATPNNTTNKSISHIAPSYLPDSPTRNERMRANIATTRLSTSPPSSTTTISPSSSQPSSQSPLFASMPLPPLSAPPQAPRPYRAQPPNATTTSTTTNATSLSSPPSASSSSSSPSPRASSSATTTVRPLRASGLAPTTSPPTQQRQALDSHQSIEDSPNEMPLSDDHELKRDANRLHSWYGR